MIEYLIELLGRMIHRHPESAAQPNSYRAGGSSGGF
jgi:hypothetical protein